MTKSFRVIWTTQAVEALHDIYDYLKEKSPQGAANVRKDLLMSPKTIVFAQQFQIDDINPKYRRISSAKLQSALPRR